jgi:hypothetical protein
MDHPSIVTAFKNAKERNMDKIFLTFKRESILYKDSYLILKGNKDYVRQAIENEYYNVNEERYSGIRSDHINLLDTPFDTWCCGACICDNIQRCADGQRLKCGSQWTHIEHASEEEQMEFINNITPGYYPIFTVEYM